MFSIYIIILFAVLLATHPTRRLALAFTPWVIFACCYDWMRFFPNYEFNTIDVKGLYDTEKNLFGITAAGGQKLILGEYFAIHHCPACRPVSRVLLPVLGTCSLRFQPLAIL